MTSMILCAQLAVVLPREAGKLVPALQQPSEATRKELRKRADRLLSKQHNTWTGSAARRALLIWGLLELEGDAFDESLDPVLKGSLQGLNSSNSIPLLAPMAQAAAVLPKPRATRFLNALAKVAAEFFLDEVYLDCGPAFKAALYGLAESSLSGTLKLRSRVNGRMVSSLVFVDILAATTPVGEEIPESVDHWLAAFLNNPEVYRAKSTGRVIAALPAARREALLLSVPSLLFLWSEHCDTDALCQTLLASCPAVLRNMEDEGELEERLRAIGPRLCGPLMEILTPAKAVRLMTRHLFWRVLLSMPPSEELADFAAQKMALEDDELAAMAAFLLSQHPVELACPRAVDACLEGNSNVRMWGARVLRALSWRHDVRGELERLTKEALPTRVLAVFADALRPVEERLDDLRGFQEGAFLHEDARESVLGEEWALFRRETEYAQLGRRYIPLERWSRAVRRQWDEGVAMSAAFYVRRFTSKDEDYLDELRENVLGQNALWAAAHVLRQSGVKDNEALYVWLCKQQGASMELHQEALFSKGSLHALAVQGLGEAGEESLPFLLTLLKSKKGKERELAARALSVSGLKQAVRPLQDALKTERAKGARAAIELALQACDPFIADEVPLLGVYRADEVLRPNEGLEQLRGILYEPATQASWVRLCDLLERLAQAGVAQMALDTLTKDVLARWPLKERILPWGWSDEESVWNAVKGSKASADEVWVPVARLMDEEDRRAFLTHWLPIHQKGARARKLTPALVGEFVDEVVRVWFWCQEHGAPLDKLRLRFDGGSAGHYQISSTKSTRLDLWMGFGVRLSRTGARREDEGGPQGPGLRTVKLALSVGHPLRAQHSMTSRQRLLDIKDLLGEA